MNHRIAYLIVFLVWSGKISVSSAQPAIVWSADTLLPADVPGCGAESSDFGASLDAHHELLVVGAPGACVDSEARGAVLIFDRAGERYFQSLILRRPSGFEGDRFGSEVHATDTLLGVSAPGDESVDLYERVGRRYLLNARARLPGDAPLLEDEESRFGETFAVLDGALIVSAPGVSPASMSGAGGLFVFQPSASGTWLMRQLLIAETPVTADSLGNHLAAAEHLVVASSQSALHLFSRRAVGDDLFLAQSIAQENIIGVQTDGHTVIAALSTGEVMLYAPDAEGEYEQISTLTPTAGGDLLGVVSIDVARALVGGATGVASLVAREENWELDHSIDGAPCPRGHRRLRRTRVCLRRRPRFRVSPRRDQRSTLRTKRRMSKRVLYRRRLLRVRMRRRRRLHGMQHCRRKFRRWIV